MNANPESLAFYTLIAVFVWREWHNSTTINKLMDRLMARSLPEYKRAQTPLKRDIPKHEPPTDAQMAAAEAEKMTKANDFQSDIDNQLSKVHSQGTAA